MNEAARGSYRQISLRDAYIDHLLGYISVNNLTPLKLVFNAGNGAAGPVIDAIEARLKALGAPVEFIKIHNTPDGTFPNGIPNPLLPECRDDTRKAVIEHGRTWVSPLTATSTAASCSMRKGSLSRGTTSSGCWRKHFWKNTRGRRLSTTRA